MRIQGQEREDVLLRRAAKGDEEAFLHLYRRHQAALYRFALRMTGSAWAAEEIVQDVFMTLMREPKKFDASRGALGAYLYGIARNRVMKHRERAPREIALEEKQEDGSGAGIVLKDVFTPAIWVEQKERLEQVRAAVLGLPAEFRETVVLCELEELSYEEAAQLIGCPVGTIRSRLHRGRRFCWRNWRCCGMCRGERARQDEREKRKMNCEEFEAMGLSIERDPGASAAERAAAREHASACSRCASLQDAWLAAKLELSALGEATSVVETPERVEMRLRQEFRTRHRTMPARRAAFIAAWALATAAVVVGAVSWRNWQGTRHEEAAKQQIAVPSASAQAASSGNGASGQKPARNNVYAAQASADGEGEFTLLPGSVGADTEDAAIWRVRMQRGALSTLGFPVNEDRAGEWIQVDFLVGSDGLPQGVRLVR